MFMLAESLVSARKPSSCASDCRAARLLSSPTSFIKSTIEVRQFNFSAGCLSARPFSTDATSTVGGGLGALRDGDAAAAPLKDESSLRRLESFVLVAVAAGAAFTAGWLDGKILLRICPNI